LRGWHRKKGRIPPPRKGRVPLPRKGRVPPPGEPAKGGRTNWTKESCSLPTWAQGSHLFRLRPRRCRPTWLALASFACGPGSAALPGLRSSLSPAAPAVLHYWTFSDRRAKGLRGS
jgi:hypothetical protein